MARKTGDTLSPTDGARLLERYGADPSSATASAAAVERLFVKLQQRFNPLIGRDGYRALLQEAHRAAVKTHPVLERYPVASEGNPFFGRLASRIGDEKPEELWTGLTALTGEFMRLAGGMGRGPEAKRKRQWELLERPRREKSGKSKARTTATVPSHAEVAREAASEDTHGRENRRVSSPWRILVMDRDRSTCEAIAHSLGRVRDFQVVERGLTAVEVRKKVKSDSVDFVVASAHLPTEEVIEVCRWLRKEHTGGSPRMVVTGLPNDPSVMLRFLEAGAAAFTLEEFSVQGLRLTLRLLARGESVFPLRLQHLLALRTSELAELVRDRGLNPDSLSSLTPREGGVLLLLEEGLTNRQIAKKLYISEGTVKSHVHQILRKLKVRDRKEAVRVLRLQRAAPGSLTLGRNGFKREI